jgi:hypothetical protein
MTVAVGMASGRLRMGNQMKEGVAEKTARSEGQQDLQEIVGIAGVGIDGNEEENQAGEGADEQRGSDREPSSPGHRLVEEGERTLEMVLVRIDASFARRSVAVSMLMTVPMLLVRMAMMLV